MAVTASQHAADIGWFLSHSSRIAPSYMGENGGFRIEVTDTGNPHLTVSALGCFSKIHFFEKLKFFYPGSYQLVSTGLGDN
jgi:hypothetical protein